MSIVPRRIGKYELQQQLGQGNAGEVWKAHNPLVNQDAAIKLLYPDLQSDPNFMTHFEQQGQVLTSLYHANLVRVREVNISRASNANETTPYIVMDYVEGQTLTDYIGTTSHKGVVPTPEQVLYLFTSLGTAIDYAHQRGFVHGNIKPGNILLAWHNTKHFEGGEPYLSDFGLTQLLGSAAAISSPLYMSPEQAKGQGITTKSDIYSLGVILYEMCTGVQPFRDESSVAIMMQHINALPTPPNLINATIPRKLSEVILRAMSKDPVARYAKASQLAAAIADAYSLQTSQEISRDRLVANEEEVYQNTSTGSILGVAQPSQKIPLQASISQPLRVQASQPLPRISDPVTGVSGKYPIIRTNPQLPALPMQGARFMQSGKLPVPPMLNPPDTSPPAPVTPARSEQLVVPMVVPQITQVSHPQAAPQVAFPAAKSRKRSRLADTPIYLACLALLLVLVVLASAAIGANALLKNKPPVAASAKVMTGHVFFQDDALGHNDQLHVDMENVPAPGQGKSYVAWFQNGAGETQLLGPLVLQNGTISYTYTGDKQHSNLLTTLQSFSVTQESSGNTPQAPSGSVVYQTQFDNAVLSGLKNILYATPGLPNKQSVVIQLLESIKSMNDKAGSINDSLQVNPPDEGLVRRQATRIIEVIDGTQFAMSSGDLPAQYKPLEHVSIGLLSSPKQKGYLDILAAQLTSFKQVAEGQNTQLEHAKNVENAVADLQDWVQKMRQYDVNILKAAVLTKPAIISTALQLKNTAADSYIGRTIPPDPSPKPILGSAGAYQAYIEAQYMAELNLK